MQKGRSLLAKLVVLIYYRETRPYKYVLLNISLRNKLNLSINTYPSDINILYDKFKRQDTLHNIYKIKKKF